MILVLPISLAYAILKNDSRENAPYASVLTGFVLGALYSFVECKLKSSYYLTRYAFFPNYAFYLCFEVLLPCFFCTAACLIFIKKRDQALLSLFFVLAAFYSVFMPARIIHRNAVFDWYLLFVKPVVYTGMLFVLKYAFSLLNDRLNGAAPKSALPQLSLCAALLVPPAIDVMHLLATPVWTIALASVAYVLFALWGCRQFSSGNIFRQR